MRFNAIAVTAALVATTATAAPIPVEDFNLTTVPHDIGRTEFSGFDRKVNLIFESPGHYNLEVLLENISQTVGGVGPPITLNGLFASILLLDGIEILRGFEILGGGYMKSKWSFHGELDAAFPHSLEFSASRVSGGGASYTLVGSAIPVGGTPVPEPAIWALTLAALGCGAIRRLHRRTRVLAGAHIHS